MDKWIDSEIVTVPAERSLYRVGVYTNYFYNSNYYIDATNVILMVGSEVRTVYYDETHRKPTTLDWVYKWTNI